MRLLDQKRRRSPGYGSPVEASKLSTTQRLTARGAGILAGAVAVATLLGVSGTRSQSDTGIYAGTVALDGADLLNQTLDSTLLELQEARMELERARALIDYSARFNIAADLAALIYDTAEEEGIDPELGFRLVYVESRFNPRAVSSASALGLTQLLVGTARFYDPEITRERLFDREVNLQIGFRYLYDLLQAFEGDLPLALIAYNRGPSRLRQLLAGGVDPRNGYASSVLDGYEPTTSDGQ